MKSRNLIDLMPGEIVIRIEHAEKLDAVSIARRLKERYTSKDSKPSLPESITIDPKRILTFDRGEPTGKLRGITQAFWAANQAISWPIGRQLKRQRTRYFSIAFTELPYEDFGFEVTEGENDAAPSLNVNPARYDKLATQIDELSKGTRGKTYRVPEKTIRIPPPSLPPNSSFKDKLSNRVTGLAKWPSPFDVQAVNFNWMSTVAQSIPTGGPGAHPQFGVKGPINPLAVVQTVFNPKSVDVFILDTIPQRNLVLKPQQGLRIVDSNNVVVETLKTPFTEWAKANPNGFHIVWETLPVPEALENPGKHKTMMEWLGSEGASGVALHRHFEPDNPNYDMSAHGLFVADIICNVANEAGGGADVPQNIYLVEALSRWGTGTLETITRALHKVYERQRPGVAAVINCSFTIQSPRDSSTKQGHTALCNCQSAEFIEKLHNVQANLAEMERVRDVLEPIFDLLKDRGAIIVAAAGNDWEHVEGASDADQRPIARYPAAYNSVIGVSALNQKRKTATGRPKPAPYSNRADEPESDGFATFVGGVKRVNGRVFADPENSIEGLYVGNFADLNERGENHKWRAYWSGTSFAAPIVSAAIAVELARGYSSENAIKSLRNLYQDEKTEQGEEVLWILK